LKYAIILPNLEVHAYQRVADQIHLPIAARGLPYSCGTVAICVCINCHEQIDPSWLVQKGKTALAIARGRPLSWVEEQAYEAVVDLLEVGSEPKGRDPSMGDKD
jgi:hypothetical protein